MVHNVKRYRKLFETEFIYEYHKTDFFKNCFIIENKFLKYYSIKIIKKI